MSIIIIAPTRDGKIWTDGIKSIDPNLQVTVWPDMSQAREVKCAVVWNHPKGILKQFPNLRLICSMGAGVDHVLSDPDLPVGVPISRIVEDKLTTSMSNFVMMAVLNYHKRFYKYQSDKQGKIWDQMTFPEIEVSIGILGLGVLGQDAAIKLKAMGFKVSGMSRTKKYLPGVTTYSMDKLDQFLAEINVLVCLLPYTPETHGILNYQLFAKMNKGSYLINVGRGKQQVETDIVRALDEGILSGAFLDVFQEEPLPQHSPIWTHPLIQFTPHIASVTNPLAAIPQIVDNYKRLFSGEKLTHLIDTNRGY